MSERVKISVPVYMYCSNEAPRMVEVEGHRVGRLVVHRSIHWFRGQEPQASTRYWSVSDITSGTAVNNALPQDLREASGVRLRDLKAWAEYWQRNPNVKALLDAVETAVKAGGQFARPEIDKDVVYAAREAGWRYPQPEYDL